MQNRFKSPVAWGTVVALLLFIGKTYNLFESIGLTENSFSELTTLIFAALVAFGIFNNPKDKDNF